VSGVIRPRKELKEKLNKKELQEKLKKKEEQYVQERLL